MRRPLVFAHTAFVVVLFCSMPSLADDSTPLSEHSTATGLLTIGAGVVTILNLEQMILMRGSTAVGIGGVAIGGSLAVAALADDADGDGGFIGIGCLCAVIGGFDIMMAHDKQPSVVGTNVTPAIRPHGWIGLQLSSSW
jgi:hypothetical protein